MNSAARMPRWIDQARCGGEEHGIFFGSAQYRMAEAKALCARCPVSGLCLEWGLAEPVGVFGGLGPKARAKLRRELRRMEKSGT